MMSCRHHVVLGMCIKWVLYVNLTCFHGPQRPQLMKLRNCALGEAKQFAVEHGERFCHADAAVGVTWNKVSGDTPLVSLDHKLYCDCWNGTKGRLAIWV